MSIYQVGGRSFSSQQEAKRYLDSLTPEQIKVVKAQIKMHLNSTYGSVNRTYLLPKMRRRREEDMHAATIWRCIFGGKPKIRTTLFDAQSMSAVPGGASLRYASSTRVRFYSPTKAERITKTGQKALRKLMAKL